MTSVRHSRLVAALVLAWGCLSGVPAAAQPPSPLTPAADAAPADGPVPPDVLLPDMLPPDAIADMVARLSDQDVRALLLRHLQQTAGGQAAAGDTGTLLETVYHQAALFWPNFLTSFTQVPQIPDTLATIIGSVSPDDWLDWLTVVATALALGVIATMLTNRMMKPVEERARRANQRQKFTRLQILLFRLGTDMTSLVVALIAALVATGLLAPLLLPEDGWQRRQAVAVIIAVAITRATRILAGIIFAPRAPQIRLCSCDTATAAFLTRQITIAVGISTIGFWFLDLSDALGLPRLEGRIGFWINLSMYLVLVWMFWRARAGVTEILLNNEPASRSRYLLFRAWPSVSMVLIIGLWLLVEIMVNTGNFAALDIPTMIASLFIVVLTPGFDLAGRAIIRTAYPVRDTDPPTLREARLITQAGLSRAARVAVASLIFLVLVTLWGIDLFALASLGIGGAIAGALVNALFIIIAAYIGWEVVRILINRKLALSGALGPVEVEIGGEGGGPGSSRMGTLLPLVRAFAGAAFLAGAVLTVLHELGINIAPLLAGAGVLGLAIGFGAQALVRDVVSGLFFLIDDAFRLGEYIDVGGTMGSVEKISPRSLRLRHHEGPVHTVPYGEIAKLTNFSRDWVVVKLKFRVPFDTDIRKIKQIFKQIGKELAAHEEFGPDLIDTFKSQGVFDFDDSAIIVRGKFTAKPGKQFLIKREVFVQVQKKFEENGIEFARKQVMVRIPGLDDGGNSASGSLPPDKARSIAAAAAEAGDETAAAAPTTSAPTAAR